MPHDKKIFAFAKVQKTVVVNCYLKLNLLAETLPMTNNGRSIIVTAHMSHVSAMGVATWIGQISQTMHLHWLTL